MRNLRIVVLALFFAGCSPSEEITLDGEQTKQETLNEDKNTLEQVSINDEPRREVSLETSKPINRETIESKLNATHFSLEKMAIDIDEANQMTIRFDYAFDEALLQQLKVAKKDLHYALEYPPFLQELLGRAYSHTTEEINILDINPAEIYTMEFTEQIPTERVTEETLQKIQSHFSGYSLQVLNKDMYAMAIFHDVHRFINVDLNTSLKVEVEALEED
ncbi:hypothetical protein G4V62_10280 [Bacillaceae bacterium SIJ1]|uniref:hypothetical protein n=1 Tax=Litoribacterium kuwaitense TaxID=1398745 RepID=UPI0013EA5038|nr:hypothetical protein [Litoribacterium kuwaitense]NGP45323.1 hypothetical protein [Litoribacterium kuwaitense]